MGVDDFIKDVVAEELSIGKDRILMDMKLGDLPQWDSLSHVCILTRIFDKFKIEIDTFSDELLSLRGISDIVKKLGVNIGAG